MNFELVLDDSDYSIYDGSVAAYFSLIVGVDDRTTAEVNIRADAEFDLSDVEWEWEPDGPASYAPWGECSYMYDDGKGGVESASLPVLDFNVVFIDENGDELDTDTVLSELHMTKEDFDELRKVVNKDANKEPVTRVEKHLAEDPDYWPDRDEEPDYEYDD